MILARLRNRRTGREIIETIHAKIVAASREPAIYVDLGVPDTTDGRFEMIALHGGLTLRRLGALGKPVESLAREVANCIFKHFDVALREMGVGDLTVPKRMLKFAEAFYGRLSAYGQALDAGDRKRLADALARNIYTDPDTIHAPALADYAITLAQTLDRLDAADFLSGGVIFPAVGSKHP